MELNTKRLTLRPEEPMKFEGDIWASAWKVTHKRNRKLLGRVWFDAPKNQNCELHFEMEPQHINDGYLFEALHTLMIWLFVQDEVKSVTATTQDEAVEAVLLRSEFVKQDERYKRIKTVRVWFFMPIFMCIGMAAGAVVGYLKSSLLMWVFIGFAAGTLLGALIDNIKPKKKPA